MTKSQTIGARLGLAMLGAGMLLGASPALAQTGNPALDGPGEALSRNLRSLAENPRSLHALMGAGKAALELGDPQAAITFFGRAEEQAPQDGRIKMWLGAALVQLQQAQGALKFFAEATAMGVPEAEVAGARGLAFDLLGDPRRAQRDYRLALQREASAEVSRRLALSLAISGEREAALQALEGQLLIRDRAAERTKAFVLALTGDAAGAARAVQASMPRQGAAMMPFLERLPALTPAERALAVHLGHFPSHARNLPVPPPNTYAAFTPSPTRAGTPDSRQTALGSRAGSPPKAQPQRTASAASQPKQQPAQTAAAAPQTVASATPAARKPEPVRRSQPSSGGTGGNPEWAWSRGTLPVRRAEPAATKPEKPAQQQQAAAAQRPAPAQQQPASPVQVAAAAPAPSTQPQQLAAATPTPVPQAQTVQPQQLAGVFSAPSQVPPAAPPVLAGAQHGKGPAAAVPAPAAERPAQTSLPAAASTAVSPGFSIALAQNASPQQPPVSELASVEAPPPASDVGEESGASRLAGIASLIASLPETPPAEERQPAPEPVRAAAKPAPKAAAPAPAAAKKEAPAKTAANSAAPAKAAAKREAPAVAKKPVAPAEPSRIWVQVAGGADKAALPREFARLKTKAPKVLAARAAWTTPLRATNRLLVGPFKTDREAQDFVNELKKAELSGFAWTSEAGQKIEKLPAK